MKWVQHLTTANQDLALRQIIEKHGLMGYGLFWLCVEMVGSQGKNQRICGQMLWKNALKEVGKTNEKDLEAILSDFSDLDLINKSAYNKGDLWMPKLKKYSDDYTKRVRRVFGQGTDNVLNAHVFLYNVISSYYITAFKEKFNKEPAIDFAKDGMVIKRALRFINGEEDAKKLIDQFLKSEKAERCGYGLSVCFSSDTLNLFFAGKLLPYMTQEEKQDMRSLEKLKEMRKNR